MNRADYAVALILALLMCFIWFRDLQWVSAADDTLPILTALPVFFWLGAPWIFGCEQTPLSRTGIVTATSLFLFGIAFNLTVLLAMGWTLLLWTWLTARLQPEPSGNLKKLLILPLIAFPWITLDADHLGWCFRLSGAWTTAKIFAFAGLPVIHEGTQILINNLPVSVEAACAGLNTLQSMLIAGTIANYLLLGETVRYWWNIPVLFVLAWLANTFRMLMLCAAALIGGTPFAQGPFHTWGGWIILLFMFGMCWMVLSVQVPKTSSAGS